MLTAAASIDLQEDSEDAGIDLFLANLSIRAPCCVRLTMPIARRLSRPGRLTTLLQSPKHRMAILTMFCFEIWRASQKIATSCRL